MTKSNLSVNEVMLRIKEAMRAENMKMNQEKPESELMRVHQTTTPNKLNELDLEIRNNNLKWNITSEQTITSHRKILGRFIVFGKKFVRKFLRWYINPSFDQQREFNVSVTRSLNITGELLREYAGQKATQDENAELKHIITEQEQVITKLITDFEALSTVITEIKSRLDCVSSSEQEGRSVYTTKITELEGQIPKIRASMDELFAESSIANDRLRRIERKINTKMDIDINIPTIEQLVEQDKAVQADIDYFLFEQRFRGNREDIKKRQEVYLKFVNDQSNVLDIGCGRGEFLELLLEKGIKAIGVDINEDMVAYCQDRGLPVLRIDALRYLEDLEDNQLGSIFGAQVIEHLATAEMIQMIRLAYSKLMPGGCIVLETVNLYTLIIFANQFYMDPSHNKPVHPETLKFILESEGFKRIQLIYSSPIESRFIPALHIEGLDSNLQEFNHGIENVNNLLFGPQDYAVIAYK
jgi:2-polyprenyl-3-methyl-5-hydroxy-6-metoxy-1,4-benzoquinol methylase